MVNKDVYRPRPNVIHAVTKQYGTSESWEVNRHITWCTNPYHVVSQCSLMPGWGWLAEISADLREAVAH